MREQAGAAAMPGHKGEKTRIESVGAGAWTGQANAPEPVMAFR